MADVDEENASDDDDDMVLDSETSADSEKLSSVQLCQELISRIRRIRKWESGEEAVNEAGVVFGLLKVLSPKFYLKL